MNLVGERVLVTGATGLIGGHLAERLVSAEGVFVRGLSRQPQDARLTECGIEIVRGDVTEPASLASAVQGCGVIFHAAGWVQEGGSRAEAWAVNVDGTKHLIDAAVAAGVKRFVHLSSSHVYGFPNAQAVDESYTVRPCGRPYSDSKVAAESVVFAAYREHRLPVVVARPSQVYGPRSVQFTIRPVEAIKQGRMMLVDGGRYFCNPVFIDDLIDGLVLCASSDPAVGEAINLTDGVAVPWSEFFGHYGRMLGVDYFRSVPYPFAWLIAWGNEIRTAAKGKRARMNRELVRSLRARCSFSNEKAKRLLGWTPRHNLDAGMKRTEAWLRAEGYL
jgi:nucleoside-diphosphate-sugar epimerase